MAEEVGAAFVSLIPSARGFSRLAQREINREIPNGGLVVPIRPEVDAAALTGTFGAITVPVDVKLDRTQVASAMVDVTGRGGLMVDADVDTAELVADTRRAVGIAQASAPTIDVGVDVDRGLLSRAFGGAERDGNALGRRVADGVQGGITEFLPMAIARPFEALGNNPIISTVGLSVGIPLAAALSSALGAGLSAALIGGAGFGVLGLGAAILSQEPIIQQAAKGLMSRVTSTLRGAAQPLIAPFVYALDALDQLMVDIGPDLREMFEIIAPAVQPLTEGFIGLVKGILPGILDLTEAAVPLLTDLASTLPRLGEDIGAFFGIISDGGPGASMFLRDLLNVTGLAIIGIGHLVAFLSTQYAHFRTVIDGAVEILRRAVVGWKWLIGEAIGAFDRLGRFIAGVWRTVRADTDGLINFIRGVPGRIVGALGNIGNLLYDAGRAVVRGLINGIKSMFGPLGDAAGAAASTIKSFFPSSPAKEGPLSGSGSPYHSGQTIATMLAGGMQSQLPVVAGAGSQLAGAVGLGAAGGRSASGVAPAAATARWADGSSGDQLLDALRDMIRIDFGGSPAAALGSA